MDHSSENGTFINKKRCDPGKVFILDKKDTIKLGRALIKIERKEIPHEDYVDAGESELLDHFEDKTGALSALKTSVQTHIDSLGKKNYQNLLLPQQSPPIFESNGLSSLSKACLMGHFLVRLYYQ